MRINILATSKNNPSTAAAELCSLHGGLGNRHGHLPKETGLGLPGWSRVTLHAWPRSPNRWAEAQMFVSKAAGGWGWLCQQLTAAVLGCSCSSRPGQHSCCSSVPFWCQVPSVNWFRELKLREGSPEKWPQTPPTTVFYLGLQLHWLPEGEETQVTMKEGWDGTDGNRSAGGQPGVRLGHWGLSFWQQQGKRLSQLVTEQHTKVHSLSMETSFPQRHSGTKQGYLKYCICISAPSSSG